MSFMFSPFFNPYFLITRGSDIFGFHVLKICTPAGRFFTLPRPPLTFFALNLACLNLFALVFFMFFNPPLTKMLLSQIIGRLA